MGTIYLKQWIVAGALSGLIIGILVFLVDLFLTFLILTDLSIQNTYFLLAASFVSNVFLGLITGTIIFSIHNKLDLLREKRRLKFVLISVLTVVMMVFISYFLYSFYLYKWENLWISSLIPFSSIVYINITIGYVFFEVLPWIGRFILFPSLVIGIAFGFLINYFINRMEEI